MTLTVCMLVTSWVCRHFLKYHPKLSLIYDSHHKIYIIICVVNGKWFIVTTRWYIFRLIATRGAQLIFTAVVWLSIRIRGAHGSLQPGAAGRRLGGASVQRQSPWQRDTSDGDAAANRHVSSASHAAPGGHRRQLQLVSERCCRPSAARACVCVCCFCWHRWADIPTHLWRHLLVFLFTVCVVVVCGRYRGFSCYKM